ncbi:TetR/AcrR family transcriptional regulator [Paenibacillus agricola]|uniref:TetR/AcrR family transcriptional regulator n=1 Tax=Paenibacillus agricola TaxID=2716264 RepID=A0ABX0JFD6_9BACL|nr:TetR/AcrR family transcriptional regulator [Paenibacillus agricola]NHN35255.1 TetR/AcrR family transcriptional regulator [Paenibacillus agricola]
MSKVDRSKVDRRINKTREAINKALIELMSEKNFENITINDISERANLNRGTLYLHYSDKYDLLDKCIKDHLSNMLKFCMLSKPGEERLNVSNSPLPMFQYFEEHFLFYSSMLSNKGITCFREQMNLVVINGITERLKTGEINHGHNKEVVVQYMASAFVGVVEWWIKNNMPLSPQIMAQQLWDIFDGNYSLVGEGRIPSGS